MQSLEDLDGGFATLYWIVSCNYGGAQWALPTPNHQCNAI